MRARTALSAALAAVTFAAPARVAAQSVLDQGVFVIWRDSAEVGREEFAITATPGRQGLQGVLVVATDRYRDREARSALELTHDHIPITYQVDVTLPGGAAERLSGQLGRGRFAVRIVSQAGEAVKEFAVPAEVVVIDDDGFDQFYFLPRPVADAPRAVNVLRPRETRVLAGEVRSLGLDTVVVGGRRVPADHFALTLPGNDAREFWFTPSGSLLKVTVPARAIVAVRSSLPTR